MTARRPGEEAAVALTNVWVQTLGDGLVRADQITGIDAHQTPALSGKPSHWLLDVVLPAPVGSGSRGEWGVNPLHRTLIQTSQHPGDAPTELARLLAQLDAIDATGVVKTSRAVGGDDTTDATKGSTSVRFQFVPFVAPPPGHHTGAEYL